MDSGKPQRWWLPGPPPPRRLVSLNDVEASYRREGIPELGVPVRSVTLRGLPTKTGPLAPYLGQLGKPLINPDGAPVATPVYLFHGCGEPVTPDVIRSFARRGPSIRFSRPSSYLSSSPAVYWSNSVAFSIAWSFFARTGSWGFDQSGRESQAPFECLIFVSRLDLGMARFDGGLYHIPSPQTPEEEEELGQVSLTSRNVLVMMSGTCPIRGDCCLLIRGAGGHLPLLVVPWQREQREWFGGNTTGATTQVAPAELGGGWVSDSSGQSGVSQGETAGGLQLHARGRGTQQQTTNMRPRHHTQSTMESLTMIREELDNIWLFAALNEASSRMIAQAGVEVTNLHKALRLGG